MSAPTPPDEAVNVFADAFYKLLVALPRSKEMTEPFYGSDVKLQKMTEVDLKRLAQRAAQRFVPKFEALKKASNSKPPKDALRSLIKECIREVFNEQRGD
jgi:hypothetical protein